jgi:hypothetical protein
MVGKRSVWQFGVSEELTPRGIVSDRYRISHQLDVPCYQHEAGWQAIRTFVSNGSPSGSNICLRLTHDLDRVQEGDSPCRIGHVTFFALSTRLHVGKVETTSDNKEWRILGSHSRIPLFNTELIFNRRSLTPLYDELPNSFTGLFDNFQSCPLSVQER